LLLDGSGGRLSIDQVRFPELRVGSSGERDLFLLSRVTLRLVRSRLVRRSGSLCASSSFTTSASPCNVPAVLVTAQCPMTGYIPDPCECEDLRCLDEEWPWWEPADPGFTPAFQNKIFSRMTLLELIGAGKSCNPSGLLRET
jgi:hypothetical protein